MRLADSINVGYISCRKNTPLHILSKQIQAFFSLCLGILLLPRHIS